MPGHVKYAYVLSLLCIYFGYFPKIKAADIEFFDQEGFVGPIYSSESMSTSCEELPAEICNHASSMITKYCVYVYDATGCAEMDEVVRLEAGNYSSIPYLPNRINSFRPCDDLSIRYKFKDQRVKIYPAPYNLPLVYPFEDYLLTTQDCRTLPPHYRNKAHLVTAPICIMFYSHPDCQGYQYRFENKEPTVLPLLHSDVDSYKPCYPEDVWKASKLHAKVVLIPVNQNEVEIENKSFTFNREMGAKTIFLNNGSGTISPNYHAEETLIEKVVVQRFPTISRMRSLNTVPLSTLSFNEEIPQLVREKVSNVLPSAFEWQVDESTAQDQAYSVETPKSFKIVQDIPIPPCSIYEAASFVKVTKDYPLHVKVTFDVTGEYEQGPRLTAEEIAMSKLGSDIFNVKYLDDYTLRASFVSMITVDVA